MTEALVETTPTAVPATVPEVPPVVLPSDPVQEKLLAGKYKTPEDLEKGYLELQKTFSSRTPEKPIAETPTQTPEGAIVAKAGLDMDTLAKEYTETGTVSDESLKAFEAVGVTRDIVQTYFKGQEALAAQEIAKVHEFSGGKAAYEGMIAWAGQNMTKPEVAAYNAAMEGEMETRKMAIEALKSKYISKTGSNPKVIMGEGPAPTVSGYASRAEMTKDMKDPRYAKDSAYRDAVAKKVGQTTAF